MAKIEQALAETLRALREEHGLTQRQAGESIGKTQTAISYWENSRRTPSPSELNSLAMSYQTTPSEIYSKAEKIFDEEE